jgi:hypothetical protein
VIVPAVIEKIDSGIERALDQLASLILILGRTEMVAANSESGDLDAGLAERPLGNLIGRRVLARLIR